MCFALFNCIRVLPCLIAYVLYYNKCPCVNVNLLVASIPSLTEHFVCWELESRWFAIKGGHLDRRFSAITELGITYRTGSPRRFVPYEFRRGWNTPVVGSHGYLGTLKIGNRPYPTWSANWRISVLVQGPVARSYPGSDLYSGRSVGPTQLVIH